MIFSLEYQIRRSTFINIIFDFSRFQKTLFSKFMPYFCQPFKIWVTVRKTSLKNFQHLSVSQELQFSECQSVFNIFYRILKTTKKCLWYTYCLSVIYINDDEIPQKSNFFLWRVRNNSSVWINCPSTKQLDFQNYISDHRNLQ